MEEGGGEELIAELWLATDGWADNITGVYWLE